MQFWSGALLVSRAELALGLLQNELVKKFKDWLA